MQRGLSYLAQHCLCTASVYVHEVELCVSQSRVSVSLITAALLWCSVEAVPVVLALLLYIVHDKFVHGILVA